MPVIAVQMHFLSPENYGPPVLLMLRDKPRTSLQGFHTSLIQISERRLDLLAVQFFSELLIYDAFFLIIISISIHKVIVMYASSCVNNHPICTSAKINPERKPNLTALHQNISK